MDDADTPSSEDQQVSGGVMDVPRLQTVEEEVELSQPHSAFFL